MSINPHRTFIGLLRGACHSLLAISMTATAWSAHAMVVDGSVQDKTDFLNFLNAQGAAAGKPAFSFEGDNLNQNGAVTLVGNARLATTHFGERIATAAREPNPFVNNIVLHVGRNLPGVFFGAFQLNASTGAENQIGHQSIDLADIFAIPARDIAGPVPGEGGTDILLHEVYEALFSLGGGDFDSSHLLGGYQAENSNRAANGSRGVRLESPPFAPDVFDVLPNGNTVFKTSWQINNPDNPAAPRRGMLVIRGKLIGGDNYTVNNVRPGVFSFGGLTTGPYYDIQFVDQFFEETSPVPEPTSIALALAGLGVVAVAAKRRR